MVAESSCKFLTVHFDGICRDGNGLAAAAHNAVSNNAKELLNALKSITTAVDAKRTGNYTRAVSDIDISWRLSEQCCKLTSSTLKVVV